MTTLSSLPFKGDLEGRHFYLFCRGDQTRTGDSYVPNVVRYQLRYTPLSDFYISNSVAKLLIISDNHKIFILKISL